MGKADLVRLLAPIERLRSKEEDITIGACRIRIAGIIEDAVILRPVKIEGKTVTLYVQIGDDPPFFQKLSLEQELKIDFTVKSDKLGL